MSAPNRDDGVLVGLAAAAALAAGLLAVGQHAGCTSIGYELAVAERENVELRQAAAIVERRASALRAPQAATARAASMKLAALTYPKTWNVVAASTVVSCAAPPAVGTPLPSPAVAPEPQVTVSANAGAR